MDRKTLEYMEERAKKGRNIVTRIEALKSVEEKLYDAIAFEVRTEKIGYAHIKKEALGKRFIENMKAATAIALRDEIEQLEQELAEL